MTVEGVKRVTRWMVAEEENPREDSTYRRAIDSRQSYIEQHAYITSICQPEATFDLSVAAQYQ